MKIIIGLGNPGEEYDNTRHNVGFDVLDKLAERLNISLNKVKFKSIYGEGRIGREKVILMKPTTYMNLSGEAVREVVDFYKVDLEDVIVIYDDIDLGFTEIRIRPKGSSGTHNGLRNIIKHLGDGGFPRVRIGVGRPEGPMTLTNFVLAKFNKDEQIEMSIAVDNGVDSIISIIENGIDYTMNKYN